MRRAALLLLVWGFTASARATVPAGYTETQYSIGLDRPVALAFLPNGQLLIAEQWMGRIRKFDIASNVLSTYADFEAMGLSPVSHTTNETGLIGLCVHPSGDVYAFATHTDNVQRIWRFSTDSTGNGFNPTLMVDNLPTNSGVHNGGGIGFGPDGRLYAVVGDNGFAGDAQSLSTLRGKVLRYDVSTVPATAAGSASLGGAIWSRGHRNPFRFAWRPSDSAMFVSENGPTTDDEINRVVSGANYGWPTVTGYGSNSAYTNPIYSFTPTLAVTDLLFYTGSTMPALANKLLYVDHKNNRISYLEPDANGEYSQSSAIVNLVTAIPMPVDVEQGPDGALYYCCLNGGGTIVPNAPSNYPSPVASPVGRIYRVQGDGAGSVAPTAAFTATPTSGTVPLAVSVNASDGTLASYSWDWGDGTTLGSGASASHTYTSPGGYGITLTVTNSSGATATSSQSVSVADLSGNPPPSAHVESVSPSGGSAPLTIQFVGHGHDDAGGLTHTWDFGDGTPAQTFSNQDEDVNSVGTYVYQNPGTYTLRLTVLDAGNLSANHSVSVTLTAAPPSPSGSGGGGCGLLGIEAVLLFLLRKRRT